MRTAIVGSSSLQKDMRAKTAAPPKKRSPEGITKAKANRLAKAVVNNLLDWQLAHGPWRTGNELAYSGLRQYRKDMIAAAEEVLLKHYKTWSAPKPRPKRRKK